jgi:hypothetical protein
MTLATRLLALLETDAWRFAPDVLDQWELNAKHAPLQATVYLAPVSVLILNRWGIWAEDGAVLASGTDPSLSRAKEAARQALNYHTITERGASPSVVHDPNGALAIEIALPARTHVISSEELWATTDEIHAIDADNTWIRVLQAANNDYDNAFQSGE